MMSNVSATINIQNFAIGRLFDASGMSCAISSGSPNSTSWRRLRRVVMMYTTTNTGIVSSHQSISIFANLNIYSLISKH